MDIARTNCLYICPFKFFCGYLITLKKVDVENNAWNFSYLCIQFHCPHSYSGNCRGCSHTRPSDRADAGTHWRPPHRTPHSNLTSIETKHSYHKLYMKKNKRYWPRPHHSTQSATQILTRKVQEFEVKSLELRKVGEVGVWLFNAQ